MTQRQCSLISDNNAKSLMPGEWDNHTCCFMALSAADLVYPAAQLAGIRREQLAIARAIARFEPVRLLVNDDDDIELADATNIQLYRINHTDMWARDTLPTFVFASDENGGKDKSLAAIGWNFNGWGNKYKKLGYDAEYDLAQRTADHFAFDFIKSNIISEGGAIETDGCGTLLTTETCLLNKNRNPGLSKLDIEIALYQTVGCRKIIWLYGSTADRVTDGHIDGIARFIRPGVVACDLIDDPLDPEYREMQENANRLAKATDVMGNPLHIVRVKRPRFDKMPPRGNDFAATYLNFYIANGGIIMPKFDDSKRDEEAFAIIDKLYPQREVIQLAVDNINEGGGGIHCVTQQLPAV